MGKHYVVGFVVHKGDDFDSVVLIRKNRPEWQAGRYNGVGGKIEPGETAPVAMEREFREETGVTIPADAWDRMCTIAWPDDVARVGNADPTEVVFFRHLWGTVRPEVHQMTDERVDWWMVNDLPDVIPNLRWLVPLAAYTADRYGHFLVPATVAEVLT